MGCILMGNGGLATVLQMNQSLHDDHLKHIFMDQLY